MSNLSTDTGIPFPEQPLYCPYIKEEFKIKYPQGHVAYTLHCTLLSQRCLMYDCENWGGRKEGGSAKTSEY